jgi:hypothetical protein
MTPLPRSIEVEFRDGRRPVPPHVAELLAGIETFRMTYEQSIAAANRRMESRVVDNAMSSILRTHFGDQR